MWYNSCVIISFVNSNFIKGGAPMAKKRRIRCFVCKNLVSQDGLDFLDENEVAYAVIPLRIANKIGCVCSKCFETYSSNIADNIEVAAGKFGDVPNDTENTTTEEIQTQNEDTVNTSKASTETSIHENEDYKKLMEIRDRYPCLEYSLDSLFEVVTRYVFGQKEAVKNVLYALYFNQMANYLEDLGQLPFKHKHILLIGGTGVGKTLLATTAAKAFGVVHSVSNATPITSAGYIGDKVENVLERLLDVANGNLEIAQNGIIILDEIDKKRSTSHGNNHDVTGKAVQQELLKLLEPSRVMIKNHTISFYTGNLTVIMMGAFVGLDEVIEARTKTHHLGFGIPDESKKPKSKDVLPDDLIEYGFIPEIVGRIPIICELNKLTHDVIVDIIYTNLERYNLLFSVKNFELYFDPVLIDKIADEIMESQTGARDVENKIDSILRPALYRVFQSHPDGICEIDSNGAVKILLRNLQNPKKLETFETEPIKKYADRAADYT